MFHSESFCAPRIGDHKLFVKAFISAYREAGHVRSVTAFHFAMDLPFTYQNMYRDSNIDLASEYAVQRL
jgi:hypothetical protein